MELLAPVACTPTWSPLAMWMPACASLRALCRPAVRRWNLLCHPPQIMNMTTTAPPHPLALIRPAHHLMAAPPLPLALTRPARHLMAAPPLHLILTRPARRLMAAHPLHLTSTRPARRLMAAPHLHLTSTRPARRLMAAPHLHLTSTRPAHLTLIRPALLNSTPPNPRNTLPMASMSLPPKSTAACGQGLGASALIQKLIRCSWANSTFPSAVPTIPPPPSTPSPCPPRFCALPGRAPKTGHCLLGAAPTFVHKAGVQLAGGCPPPAPHAHFHTHFTDTTGAFFWIHISHPLLMYARLCNSPPSRSAAGDGTPAAHRWHVRRIQHAQVRNNAISAPKLQ